METLLTIFSRRIFLVLLFALSGFPVCAQQSALLVGISTREAPGAPEFVDQRNQTFLVESDGRTAKLMATLPDIIVPRGQGFWRIGVTTNCSSSGDNAEASAPNRSDVAQEANDSSFDETFYMNPVEVSPRVRALDRDPSRSCDPNPCDFHNETIWFVNSRFVSTDFYQGKSDECEPRGYSWYIETHVRRLGGTDPVSFKELTGDDGWEAYNFAVREASYNIEQGGTNCEVFTDRSEVLEDTNWTLRRDHGKWIAQLRWQVGNGACEYVDDIDLALPETLTDYDSLTSVVVDTGAADRWPQGRVHRARRQSLAGAHRHERRGVRDKCGQGWS